MQPNKYRELQRTTLSGFLTTLIKDSYRGAKNRELEFKIGSNYLLELYNKQEGLCSLSGIKMTFDSTKSTRINRYNISVDRIDSSKGYIKNNIQLVCVVFNIMKLDYTNKEFIEFCNIITKANVK